MPEKDKSIEIKTRPIIFNSDMICAILDGRKSQTRRVIKPQPKSQGIKSFGEAWEWKKGAGGFSGATLHQLKAAYGLLYHCPFGIPGDKLWVRETFKPTNSKASDKTYIHYRADAIGHKFELNPEARVEVEHNLIGSPNDGWRPKRQMPRWASRITLEITDIRVERLKELTDDDCRAEGIRGLGGMVGANTAMLVTGKSTLEEAELFSLAVSFIEIWDKLNTKRGHSWESNPWVWVVEFKVLNG